MTITANKGVTVVDAAGTVLASSTSGPNVKVRKIVLVAAGAAVVASVTDGADKLVAMLAAPAGSSDEIDFNADGFMMNGLKVSVITAGAFLFLYGG